MGMFDWYRPRPQIQCPQCRATLASWQGKDGPCGLFEWVSGGASPVAQLVDDHAIEPEKRAELRLPDEFDFYTECDACKQWVEAHGSCSGGVWSRTDLVRPLPPPGLPDGWNLIESEDRPRLIDELRREAPAGHALHGKRLLPVARRNDRDDVLFQELSTGGALWLVHLTWQPEHDPLWPHVVPFRDLGDFRDDDEIGR